MPKNRELAPIVTPLVFLDAYHHLPGISQGERVDYYGPLSIDQLQRDIKSHIQAQLDLFVESYGECFENAEYGGREWDDLLGIEEDEVPVFKMGLRPEVRGKALRELDPIAILVGLESVIFCRISRGSLDGIRAALELFNDIIECAVLGDNRNPRSSMSLEAAELFAPRFTDTLLELVECPARRSLDPFLEFVAEKFEAIQPLLNGLRFAVRQEGWPRNDLDLGRFLMIVDHFKQVVEEGIMLGHRNRPPK